MEGAAVDAGAVPEGPHLGEEKMSNKYKLVSDYVNLTSFENLNKKFTEKKSSNKYKSLRARFDLTFFFNI